MNDKEARIINATQRGIARARRELAANPHAWEDPLLLILDPEARLEQRLSSELCGYYAAMVQHWVDLGAPDIFT